MYPTSHVWSSNIVSVNLDAWKSLSETNRTAIASAAQSLQSVFWTVSRYEDDIKAGILNKNGVKTGPLTPEMLSDMQIATNPMVGEYIQAVGPAAKAVIEGFLADVGRK